MSIASAGPTHHPIGTSPRLGEKVFTVLVILYSTGAFLPILQGERDPQAGEWTGALITNATWIVIYAISLQLLSRYCKARLVEALKNWMLLSLLGFVLLSIVWSDAPLLTFLRSASLMGSALIALYLVLRFSTRRLLVLCAWAITIGGVCSFLLVVLYPSYGMGSGEFADDWLGVYGQKNALGASMAIGFLVVFLLLKFTKARRSLNLAIAGLMLLCIYLSGSMTSLVICLGIPFIFWITRLVVTPSSSRELRRLGVLAVALSALLFAMFHAETILESIGRDPSLTGRVELWALVLQSIQERPILGFGYEAFWRGYEGNAGEIWQKMGQFLFYSHNGLLEVWLGLGVVGVVLVLACIVLLARHAYRQACWYFCLETAWPCLFLCYLFLSNLTEVSILRGNTLPMILFFALLHKMHLDSNLSWSHGIRARARGFGVISPGQLRKSL